MNNVRYPMLGEKKTRKSLQNKYHSDTLVIYD